jgi:HAE1 family hydrophobic/amphiphilic exporter-1
MNFIETAVRWRHGTFVLFCLLAGLGIASLLSLPLELQPGGDRPEITITTGYPGAAPAEVETLITRPIEEQMEEVLGVKEISSTSGVGRSRITLEFAGDTNIQERLLDVINRLQQVNNLPPEAQESNVELVGGNSSPMMWIPMDTKEGFTPDPNRYRYLVEEVILPRLRRVEGVGQFFVVGGQEREVEIKVDPKALADRNLTLSDVVRVLRENNRDIRGGPLILGRREYRVRTLSRSTDLEHLKGFVLRKDASGTIFLGDVATVEMGRKPQDSALIFNGKPGMAIGIIRQIGANVPAVAQGVRAEIAKLQAEFDRQNQGISFVYNYDESKYINQAIAFVQENLVAGAFLATLVLLLFLGSLRTVAVVALTIPTTLLMVFIVMSVLGLSLNIISLAGIAFSVGMVVDNAIVVIENVFTHLEQGKSPLRAAIDGTQEVWGAMLGSTLTNVVVFIPLIAVTGEAGKLYADMAIALSAASLFSLFAAITLVPMLSGLFLHASEAHPSTRVGNWLERGVAGIHLAFNAIQTRIENWLTASVAWSLGQGRFLRRLFLLSLPLLLLFLSLRLLPPVDYLPEGNRNLVIVRAEPLPGTSIPEAVRQSEAMREFLRAQPEVDRILYVDRPGALRGIATILKPEYATNVGLNAIVERLRSESGNFAGYRFIVPTRISIFRDPGKEFEIDIVGPDLEELSNVEKQVMGELRKLEGVRNVRSNFVAGAGELQVIPNRLRTAEVGLSEAEVGLTVEAALGGRIVSEFVDGKEELDVSVELQDTLVETPEQLRQLPIYNGGRQVQLGDIATIQETTGADVINHIDLERSISLTVSVANDAPLGELVATTETQILAPLRESLPSGYRLELAGSADQLATTVGQLVRAFLFSLAVTYLLLVALYRSFLYPLVIMATVPMGMGGALMSLVIANRFLGMNVALDMITALGFIILTGVVVNNAILLVDRALQLQDAGEDYDTSLYRATGDRLRAIFMSAGTTVLGMLPLAVLPGQGSELYQGLGIILTGGLAFSTLLTPTVVPALMALLRDLSGRRQVVLPQTLTSSESVTEANRLT